MSQEFTISSGPLPGSEKIYVKGEMFDIEVPMRRINLTPTIDADGTKIENEPVVVYDTSGPYTDPNYTVDLHKGLPKIREQWIADRNDTVKLEGKGFEILVEQGQHVKKGEPLMKIDIPYLTENAPSLCSPILCTEIEDNQRVRLLANGEIKAGEPLFAVETVEE